MNRVSIAAFLILIFAGNGVHAQEHELIGKLNSSDRNMRIKAVVELLSLKEKGIPIGMSVLTSKESTAEAIASVISVVSRSEKPTQELIEAVGKHTTHASPHVRAGVARAFGLWQPMFNDARGGTIQKHLASLYFDEDAEVRRQALWLMRSDTKDRYRSHFEGNVWKGTDVENVGREEADTLIRQRIHPSIRNAMPRFREILKIEEKPLARTEDFVKALKQVAPEECASTLREMLKKQPTLTVLHMVTGFGDGRLVSEIDQSIPRIRNDKQALEWAIRTLSYEMDRAKQIGVTLKETDVPNLLEVARKHNANVPFTTQKQARTLAQRFGFKCPPP